MKYIFYWCLFFVGLSVITACSNGDYVANPSSNSNGGINPLNPLKASQFTWTGTNPLSADVNGSPWVATNYTYSFDSGRNTIIGTNGNKAIVLVLTNTYANNLYSMGYQQYQAFGYYTDSLGDGSKYYYSYLGSSGGVYMNINNDTIGIKGLFYFQGINSSGNIVNITNGYFNIPL